EKYLSDTINKIENSYKENSQTFRTEVINDSRKYKDDILNQVVDILKTNLKTPVKISEIFDFIFSYLSTHNGISKIKYENYLSNDYIIQANRILLCRAIINLIINAYEVSKDKVEIVIKDYKKYFYIIIKDEGPGISDEDILRIYNDGFSTKNSTGLGLSFVNKVLEEHECKIFFKKGTDIGTKVYLKFLIGGKDGK
ncbi:MAG: HAMP domain-containing sensor histidine kinase, partial [Cetobacterium sp.]